MSSGSSFDPMPIATNSNTRMIEVSNGVYLQGKDLDDYCHKRGRCKKCVKVVVSRKVVKVFGSNTWEPITVVKVPMHKSSNSNNNSSSKHNSKLGKAKSRSAELRGMRIKNKASNKYNTVKAKIESGNDDNVEYLVYKGYCLRDGCYTLDQAKRLSGCSTGGIGGGIPFARRNSNDSSLGSGSNSNSINSSSLNNSSLNNSLDSSNNSINSSNNNSSNSSNNRRAKLLAKALLFGRSSKFGNSHQAININTDQQSLLRILGETSPIQEGSSTVSMFTSPSNEVSSKGEVGNNKSIASDREREHDNHQRQQQQVDESNDHTHKIEQQQQQQSQSQSSVIPSPQVRKNYEHEFSRGRRGKSPKKRYHSRDLYEIGSDETDEPYLSTNQQQQTQPKAQTQSPPIREIVQRTVSALKGLSSCPAIRTLDLTGLQLRRSEMEALSKLFKAGKNGTVHLTALALDNCGIDDGLLGILGQAIYDALFTTNNKIGEQNSFNRTTNNSSNNSSNTAVTKSMRHARMRLKSLSLGDNDIGNIGIHALCLYLESISCELETLDLSRNRIENDGGVAIFDALKRNPQTKIRSINLSCNLLRELDDTGNSESRGQVQQNQQQQQQYRSCSPLSIPASNPSSFGVFGFLSKNKTLKELNLSANRMTDEWVEALCGGLSTNGGSVLETLNLGFNRIGNRGALAISKCLRSNQSLVLVELNDNHIQNEGGQALLMAMEDNTTLKDISGLWSNKIEKRHIIVEIRQLLVSEHREPKKESRNSNKKKDNNEDSDDSGVDVYITSDSESTRQTRNTTGNKNLKLLEEEQEGTKPDLRPGDTPIKEESENNISDFFSVEDNGNVSDLSDQEDDDLSDSYERLLQDNGDANEMEEASDGMMETNQEATHNMFDRITIMNSSPLVCFDDKENNDDIFRGIPLLDTLQETKAIKSAILETTTRHLVRGSRIEVREEMATLDRFRAFFEARDSAVLHLSCHGFEDGIAFEDGYGSLETLSLDDLNELLVPGGDGGSFRDNPLELVFVSSPSALKIGTAFLDAGAKHVVCCQRDDAYRDPVALEFMESFYEHASQKETTLTEAFGAALRKVISSPKSRSVIHRFHLLPLPSPYPPSPIFFQRFVPNSKDSKGDDDQSYQWNHVLPPLPDHFLGREIEIFKILESLQVADCVEISGSPGCGKACALGASLEYAMKRNETFSIDHVCWIPAPKQAMVDPDSLYGDLILCCDLIRESNEDIWDRSEEVLDCRERLAIELDKTKVVVVIDNRSFSSRGSRAALEKLANFLVTYTSAAKVIFISTPIVTTNETEPLDYSAIKTCHIEIDALSFRSTVHLFGELSEHISRTNELSIARSATEFSELADVPFVSQKTGFSSDGGSSKRRTAILERIGNGQPSQVVASAKSMTRRSFDELMKVVLTPEISIDSLGELQNELRRWNTFVDLAIKDKNYRRSVDLQATIDSLEEMRLRFTSLKDLKAKEKSMKLELADAVSNRRYDVANELKRDLLALKKKIMKERRVSTNRSTENPNGVLSDFKFQVNSLADTIEHDESLVSNEETSSFDVDCDGRTCTFIIYSGSVFDPKYFQYRSDPKDQLKSKGIGIVCWSNEACDLEGTLDGKSFMGLEAKQFKESVANLPILEENRHGSVRCSMGSSVVLNPRSSSSMTDAGNENREEIVDILTVGPFASPSGQIDSMLERDNDYHRFGLTTLRSCYRACVRQTQQANLRSLAISPLTTRANNGRVYEETLKVAVREIVEEANFSSGLREVHLVGKTPKEATLLVGIMKTMGLSFRILESAQTQK